MLTDEQARRFCECESCSGGGEVYTPDFSVRACPVCAGSGIDPAKRKELEELLREMQQDAWRSGYVSGYSDGRSWVHASSKSSTPTRRP